MTDDTRTPVTEQDRRLAILRLDPMVCPLRVYEQIIATNFTDTLERIVAGAVKRGWARTGDRVAHVRTDAPGEVTDVIQAVTWQAETGPWAHVQFDDGLACWCPVSALRRDPS